MLEKIKVETKKNKSYNINFFYKWYQGHQWVCIKGIKVMDYIIHSNSSHFIFSCLA